MRIIIKTTSLLLIIFLFFTGILPAYAKSETFDIFTYKVPAGYEKDTSKDGMVTYTKVKGNKFCLIGIYTSRQSSGNSAQDFENEWNELVAKPFGIGDGKVIKEANDSGWDIMVKADKAQTEGTGEFYVALTSFSGHGKVSSVIVNYNDEAFNTDIDNFITSIEEAKGNANNTKQTITSNNIATNTTSQGSNSGIKGKGVVGVWMGYTSGGSQYNMITKSFEYSTVRPEVAWRIFFSDGTYSQGMPFTGLYSLDIAQSQQDERDNKPTGARWGHYTVSGNTISVHHNTITNDKTITIINTNQIKDHNDTFYKCESVDGLKLNGVWGWTPDTTRPQDNTLTHAIQFSKNGQFTDYGIFTIDLNEPDMNPQDAPGSGTYQIRDFTLILNYSDGRVVQKSFSIYKTVSPTAKIIYINGNDRYKLN